jgi:hypothetical protein
VPRRLELSSTLDFMGKSMLRTLTMLLAISAFMTIPAVAQRGHGGGGFGHGSSGGFHAPSVFRGGPRGPVGWSDFHHDTAPAKVSPHRFGDTSLPLPSSWHGNIRDFDLHTWQSGKWQHVNHGGRSGWWWTVGSDWYFFDAPVYPYPDLYTPYNEPIGWWYWCDPSEEYYPYVTSCPIPWESVMPQD